MVCTYFRTISSRRLSRVFFFVVVGLVAVSPSISIDRGALAPLASAAQGPTYPFEAATSRVSSVQGQPFSRNHLSTSRWPPNAAYAHVDVPHGQSFSRNHFSTSSWPYSAARARPLAPRAVVLAQPLRTRAGRPSPRTRTSTCPRAAVRARPLQHLEVATLRRDAHVYSSHGQSFARAHFNISRPPFAAFSHVSRSTRSRSRAPTLASRGGRTPPRSCTSDSSTGSRSRAPTSAPRGRSSQPRTSLSHAQPSRAPTSASRGGALRRPRARVLVPRAVALSRPLQSLEVAALRRARARILIPREVVCARPAAVYPSGGPAANGARRRAPLGSPLARAHCQHLEWPTLAACRTCTRPTRPGQSLRRRSLHSIPEVAASCRVSRTSPRSHREVKFRRAHCSVSRWPPSAAFLHTTALFRTPLKKILQHRQASKLRGEKYLSDPLSSRRPRRACRGSPCGAPRGPARVPPKLSGREVSVRSAASRDSLAG